MKKTLFTELKAKVPLVDGRIYSLVAPQRTGEPFLVCTQISEVRDYSFGGFSNLTKSRLQISCYGKGYAAVKDVVEQVTGVMESVEGVYYFLHPTFPITMTDGKITAVFKINELDFFEEDTRLFHVAVDFFVWHNM